MAPRSILDDFADKPHDSLVKRIFTNPEAARAELRAALPTAVVERLDWSTLRVGSGSYIDGDLRQRASDILYEIDARSDGATVGVYVLMEHQSRPDRRMAVRFFVYVARVYDRYLRETKPGAPVPLVIPLLMYQRRTPWPHPTRLSELVSPKIEGMPPPVELEFRVDDLSASLAQAQARQHQRGLVLAELARTMLWLYANPDATDSERAAQLGPLFAAVERAWGPEAVEPFLAYLLSAFVHHTPIRDKLLSAAPPEASAMFVTMRQAIEAKGRAEGRAKGHAEGRAEGEAVGITLGASRMLMRVIAARGLALEEAQRARIEACTDEALLGRWLERALVVDSAQALFDGD